MLALFASLVEGQPDQELTIMSLYGRYLARHVEHDRHQARKCAWGSVGVFVLVENPEEAGWPGKRPFAQP